MKRLIYSLVILSILLFACTISTTGTPPVGTAPLVVTATPIDTELPVVSLSPVDTTSPVVTIPSIATNVTCHELSLYLDPALASGYTCETIPESPEGMEVYPQCTKLTLQGYVLSDKFFNPHISVFPVQRYNELLPDVIPGRISDLQALIGGGAPGDSMPLLPVFNAAQEFYVKYEVLPFVSGEGIRFLTEYAQFYDPINNHDMFYTYQGLTTDGKYWISLIFPVSHPSLPENGNNPPGGQSVEDFGNNFNSYIAGITSDLEAQPPQSFTPGLGVLKTLVSSITIQP